MAPKPHSKTSDNESAPQVPYDPSQVDMLLEGEIPTSGIETLKANQIMPLYQRLQDVGELSDRCANARTAYQTGLEMAGRGKWDPRRIYHAFASRGDEFKDLSIEGVVEVLSRTLLRTHETISTLIPQAQEALSLSQQYELELADNLIVAQAYCVPVRQALAQEHVKMRSALSSTAQDRLALAQQQRARIAQRQSLSDANSRAHRLESWIRVRETQLERLEPLQEAMQMTYEFLVSAKDSLQLEREYIEHNALAYAVSDHMVRHAKAYGKLFSDLREGMFRLDELPVRTKSTIRLLGKALYGR